MELGAFDVDGGHLGVGYDNSAGGLAGVEFTAHSETGFGSGGRDQLDDDPIADEWLGAPVLADEGEEAVPDFVSISWARRPGADPEFASGMGSRPLPLAFAHQR